MDQGTITGLIQDSTDGAIPGAQVTLTNTETGLSLKAQSDQSGIYIFSPVKIGTYKVNGSAAGFETTSQEHVRLDLGERLNVTLTLKPGATMQTVTVLTAPPILQTQSGSVGQVISTNAINTTPLNGRNWVYIAQLTAAVDPATGSRGSGNGDFEANGRNAGQNNFILDGMDNNSSSSDFLSGSSLVVRPPPECLSGVQDLHQMTTAPSSATLPVQWSTPALSQEPNNSRRDLRPYFSKLAWDAKLCCRIALYPPSTTLFNQGVDCRLVQSFPRKFVRDATRLYQPST